MCEFMFDCRILNLAQSELARQLFQTLILILSLLSNSYTCAVMNLSSRYPLPFLEDSFAVILRGC